MQVNACIYGCIWPYIPIYAPFWCPRGAETYSQCIHTQEAGVHYTQLTQLWCSATQLPCRVL